MSGGAWGYQQFRIEELAERLPGWLRLLGQLERELDWGRCGDTCYECARLRAGEALATMFDVEFGGYGGRAEDAIAVAKDRTKNQCGACRRRTVLGT